MGQNPTQANMHILNTHQEPFCYTLRKDGMKPCAEMALSDLKKPPVGGFAPTIDMGNFWSQLCHCQNFLLYQQALVY